MTAFAFRTPRHSVKRVRLHLAEMFGTPNLPQVEGLRIEKSNKI